MARDTVQFDVELVFPKKDLELDPNRYTGNEPQIVRALLQKGLANKRGYLTRKGKRYFGDGEESRKLEARLTHFTESAYDNYDRECAYRDYHKYVLSCPRKVMLTFTFPLRDFEGDPLQYCGEIDPLLVEQGFFNKKGYLTSKALAIVSEVQKKTIAA